MPSKHRLVVLPELRNTAPVLSMDIEAARPPTFVRYAVEPVGLYPVGSVKIVVEADPDFTEPCKWTTPKASFQYPAFTHPPPLFTHELTSVGAITASIAIAPPDVAVMSLERVRVLTTLSAPVEESRMCLVLPSSAENDMPEIARITPS